jgi:hypothetical protein
VKFCTEDLDINLSRTSRFVQNLTKMSETVHENPCAFYCCKGHGFATTTFLCSSGIFLWLTMTCDSTIQRETTVAFPLQQWLREGAMISRYTLTRLIDERGKIFSLLQKIQIDCGAHAVI